MPNAANVHIDAAMTQISVKHKNAELVADKIFPEVPVQKQSDKYYTIGKEAYRLDNDTRRPGTRAKAVDFSLSNNPYYCDGHALEYDVPDEVRENADTPIQADIDGTEFTTDKMLLIREKATADLLRDTSQYPVANVRALAGASKWSDYSGTSDPILDVRDMAAAVFAGTWGKRANTILIPYPVHQKLKDHPKIIERIKYSERGVVTPQLLAELFEIENVIFGDAVYDSSNEGGTPTQAYVWGKDVILAYVPGKVGLREVALGYSFRWKKTGTTNGVVVTRWREEARKTDCLMAESYYDQRLIVAGAGAVIQGAVN